MQYLKNILLVEDDPFDVELIITSLAESGLANHIDVVSDGEEALDYLHCRGKFGVRDDCVPGAVLLDLKLPKIGGLEVLKHIRADKTFKCLPVVILTSSGEEEDIIAGYELGTNAYVVKPLHYLKFVSAIRELGAFWAILNEPPRLRKYLIH
jgi:DNA-binding response OmpR family regulator